MTTCVQLYEGQAAVAGQGSLSFPLLGAGRGLYNFGRTLCLLSTVTGLRIPPHNFIAVNNVKSKPFCGAAIGAAELRHSRLITFVSF